MKNFIFAFAGSICLSMFVLVPTVEATSTRAVWDWVKGTNVGSQRGIYGTQGIEASTNMPGARSDGASLTGPSGELWLFGGAGVDGSGGTGHLNDLWKLNPATTNWTWIKGSSTGNQCGIYGTQGIPDSANTPGSRWGAALCVDGAGTVWLFGGTGYGASGGTGRLNDLWKFNPTTARWTWMSGSTNVNQNGFYGTQGVSSTTNTPGGRHGAVSWTDSSGSLWLFGGYGYPASGANDYLNDLWKYDTVTTNWTWLKGANYALQNGIYGIKGTADPANMPGAREAAASWMDSSGTLWIFGGYGSPASGGVGCLNDMWKFNPVTTNWTWTKGSSSYRQSGIYGTKGIADAANTPGARQLATSWIDGSGALWLFGGNGYPPSGVVGFLNDAWKYDPATANWTWMQGADYGDQSGVYGTQGKLSLANTPGARYDAMAWCDSSGTPWLFGGMGRDRSGGLDRLNDLWTMTMKTVADVQVSKRALTSYSLLLHADGLDGSTYIYDECGHSCTAVNNAHLSTNTQYFGESSLLFDGSSDYLQIPDSPDFEPGSQAFTIDFWLNPSSLGGGQYIMGKSNPDAGQGYDIRLDNGFVKVCGVDGWPADHNIVSDRTVVTGTWQHVAVCASTTNVLLFIDGVLSGSCGRQTIGATAGREFTLGYTTNFGGTNYSGYLDEVRFLLGKARWTSSFQPATAAYALDQVDAGEELTYRITVSNAGPDHATDVAVTENLPAGVTPSGSVLANIPLLTAGTCVSYDVTVVVGPNTLVTLTNTVSVTSSTSDFEKGNDQAVVVSPVISPLRVIPAAGPAAGGNTVTVTNGYFGDITNVLVGGISAMIQASGTGWVTFAITSAGPAGLKDIVVQTSDNGDINLPSVYTVNPAGAIGGVFQDFTRWQNVEMLSKLLYSHAAAGFNGAFYAIGGVASSTIKTNVFRSDGTNWTEVAGLPDVRCEHAAAGFNGALYSIGGINFSGVAKTNVYQFDGSSWTEVAGLPEPRCNLAAAEYNGALYAIGGIDSSGIAKASVYRFDGTSWTEVAGLPDARYYHAAAVLDGALYSIGGADGFGAIKQNVYRFNGTTWTEVAGLPGPRGYHAAAELNGALYSIGGIDGSFLAKTNVYRFDGTSWTEVAGLPDARAFHAAAGLNGELYSIGGRTASYGVSSNVYRYPFRTVYAEITPSSCSCTGGYQVVISGPNLGNGSDITNVTLCGVAANITGQSTTQVVVTAGESGIDGAGDVRVFSTSFGETVKSNAFTYTRESQAPLVFSPASPQAYGMTNALSASGGSGTGGLSYAVVDGPGVIVDGTNLTVTSGTGTISVCVTKARDAAFHSLSVTSQVTAIRADQSGLAFTPASPQTYNTTNALIGSGGGSSGAWTFSVTSGAGTIVGATNLWLRTGTGSVVVRATKAGDTNWNQAYVEATIDGAKAPQSITFGAIPDQLTTNRVGLTASAASGLPVSFAVDSGPAAIAGGTSLTFTASGLVGIVATQSGDTNWNAATSVTNTFNVSKAGAGVTLNNLAQTYSGSARAVTASTAPVGLEVVFTYDGRPVAPTNVGTYAVTGTVNDLIYTGVASGTLTVSKASQTVDFAQIPHQRITNVAHLAATAGSGLPVTFAVVSGPAVLTNGTDVVFSDRGAVTVRASQAGDSNWNPASTSNSFRVGVVVIPDFDGDGIADVAVYWPQGGNWYLRNSNGGSTNVTWGWSATMPTPGDYDGDGMSDVSVYWAEGGNWYLRFSGGGSTNINWGWNAAVPVQGDYDGDGKTDIAVYWPQTGNWYLRYSGGGTTNINWGWSAAVPVQGDYDGDGKTDIAVYWPQGGNWYVMYSSGGSLVQNWGWSAAAPVPADYDGDGKTDIGVYNAGNWYLLSSGGGSLTSNWGWNGALPVPGDYDGDGMADMAVYRPDGGKWYLRYSGGGSTNVTWGWNAAQPVLPQYQVNRLMKLLP